MSAERQTHIANAIAWGKNVPLKHLVVSSDVEPPGSPGGKARSPRDFTCEVAMVNRWIAKNLCGEKVPPMERDGWVTAASGAFADTMDQALSA